VAGGERAHQPMVSKSPSGSFLRPAVSDPAAWAVGVPPTLAALASGGWEAWQGHRLPGRGIHTQLRRLPLNWWGRCLLCLDTRVCCMKLASSHVRAPSCACVISAPVASRPRAGSWGPSWPHGTENCSRVRCPR